MCSSMVNFWYTNSVSVRRVCRSRQRGEFVKRDCCVYGSLMKIVPHLSLFKPFHNQGKSEVTFNRQWLAAKISDNIYDLIEIGLCVRDIVTNKHSTNVNVFSALKIIPFKIKLLYIAPTKE